MSSRDRAAQLREVIEGARDASQVVLLSGHPDPDAIGAALAHRRLCERFGIATTIAHTLPVSRAENRALVKLLDVPLQRITSSAELARFRFLSLVDTTVPDASLTIPAGLELLTVVDHHRAGARPEARFVDIRPEVGATCTIYAEYFEAGLEPLTPEERSAVGSAMFFGIQTDTDDFGLASSADFRAAAYLKPYTDAELLSRLGRRALTAEEMTILGRALAGMTVVRDFAIAGVGRVSAVQRDAIPTAADFILRREDIDTVLVFGVVEDRVDGSLRTRRASVDPAVFLHTAFGEDSSGRPYGGGRNEKGGFQIPLGMLAEASEPETLWRLVEALVHRRVARVVPDLERALGG